MIYMYIIMHNNFFIFSFVLTYTQSVPAAQYKHEIYKQENMNNWNEKALMKQYFFILLRIVL